MSIVIDRRLNDRNKNAVNRQRFLRRYKDQIRKSVNDLVARRSITDMDQGGVVNIPVKDISEPVFHHGPGGDRELVNSGNRKFNPGDRIPRPRGGGGGSGGGSKQGEGGENEDGFMFSLSREEFMNLFFDDLELPHLVRNAIGDIREFKWQRAGYTPDGAPCNLSVPRSLRQAMARRIALGGPLKKELSDAEARGAPEQELERLRGRIGRIPFLDEIDLRFRHRVKVPQPISRAVMFCLMDVSASMTEEKKDLAKRFFTLLYLFLTRKYEHVDLVFIRHTDDAQEVDEDAFFHDTQSGGTVVLSALKLMHKIMQERYPIETWNLYGAQVSDGDAFGADPEKSRAWLTEQILPTLRYFAYIETPDDEDRTSPLSYAYERIESERFAMKSVSHRNEVYPVLRELFRKEAHA
ncbi:MAG TPA: YeaH/YhbH family protein [Candidatus Binatia bacterium]|nr:YeaH/YhbH family protein [Candidatus Binatia bacterium]